ncbi:hypothetical protein VKT23_013252 [Stygiomarasmius scandens]|uniref:SGNH hydrolase-type esterase domain-containing protein n=1 Tax=Marasmiellus scandens TaxID=2682957 RepID=A0ABR1J6S0_9AGAR
MNRTAVIFGDSYSVSSNAYGDGDVSTKSWASYLEADHDFSIHNFAVPGATAEDDLEDQLSDYLSVRAKLSASSSPKTIYYVFFFGINDCGRSEVYFLSEIVEKIMDAADRLYTEAGARHFTFIDVPPIDRSPGGLERSDPDSIKTRVNTWNRELQKRVSQFISKTPKVTVTRFSVHDALSAILDDPEEYDFTEDDTTDQAGAIWADELHLTSDVHQIIAEKMVECFGTS